MPAKRAVDLTGSLILLLLLLPALLTLAVAVAVTSPGPVLTRRDRTGLSGRPFAMLTFRTRRNDQVDDTRDTLVGRPLRRHFLDKLPQLINVVRGEMSLVGPRPLAPEDSEPATGAGRARLGVRPGITGLWQISGRSELPWEEMDVLDLHYVEQHWLGLDLLILARTLPAAVAGRRPVPAGAPVRLA
ncbi:sugar transferase [Streptomyces lunaelactis]|uniref:sugar transferase n=1 Tax=Streptomyces lunaelactis TaxID=1535768 RepID=UPI001584C200|nr:sugar transferase [Streptomyces lunaelactis]NUK34311.1 sugar transferase [Streptomyces lunaelactis]NUK41071.1 sugar transferase [Streptomyces lunaelactis]NUK72032.1 sugar transferase [Streptomyces lunaelactis]NUK81043.1 sugar transferase [Streptomyces lunaelactis]NUK91458.1 sugar transferase [Streptomyces lunaelactis]